MPNHVTNTVTFGSDSASLSEFHNMLEFVKADDSFFGSIDFNKLFPMPPSLDIPAGTQTDKGLKAYKDFVYVNKLGGKPTKHDITNIPLASERAFLQVRTDIDQKTWDIGKVAWQNTQKYGAPTWYEWCIKNWGTKWNAYDCAPLKKNAAVMKFLTAWDSVPKIISAISKRYPAATITYRWADEDIGHNVGERIYKNGEAIQQHIPKDGSKEAYEMSADIVGIDLADFGLRLSKDKSTFEYHDEPIIVPTEKKPQKKKSRDQAR